MSRQVKKVNISGKEDKSNKVSSWSNTTTDIHYPSEKLVKDSLDAKLDKTHTSYKGKNVVTNASTGAIEFEDKNNHTHNKKIYYGYTDTSPNTRIKEVVVDGNFVLEDGILLILSSTYGNTYSDTYYHTQLNINNTGAVDVYGSWIDGTSYSSIEINGRWQPKETIILYYDSDKWVLIDDGIATTTNYGATKLQDSLSNDTNLAITPNAVNTAINNHTHNQYLTQHQDISGKENTSNKVSSWSSTPTDIHYPSEKLVKEYVDGLVGSAITYIIGSGS